MVALFTLAVGVARQGPATATAASTRSENPSQDPRVPEGPAFEDSVGHHGEGAHCDLERQLGEAADTTTAALARRTATGRGLPPGDQAHRPRVRRGAGRRPERTRVRDRTPRGGPVERGGDPFPGRPRGRRSRDSGRPRLPSPGGT